MSEDSSESDMLSSLQSRVEESDSLAPAPEEVENDAVEELNRIHSAELLGNHSFDSGAGTQDPFDLGGGYGLSSFDDRSIGSPMSFSPIESPEVKRQQFSPSKRDISTLEDLYEAYPDVGDGTTHIRVHRKSPSKMGGQIIDGWLEDLHRQITMDSFAQRYGGGTYEVSVRGPGNSRSLDPSGRMQARTLHTLTLKLPGTPKVFSSQEESGMDSRRGYSHVPGGESDQVTLRKMDLDFDREKRLLDRERELQKKLEDASNNRFDPRLMTHLTTLAEKRASEAKDFSATIISQLRQDIAHHQQTIQDLTQRLNDERESKVRLQTDFSQKIREEETRQVRDLRVQQEQQIAQLRAQQAEQVERMQREHERRISEMTERHQRDLSEIREMESRERERLRDDASRREKGLQDDFSRREQAFRDREQAIKEDFARREESARRDYEARLQQMERANKRDIEMLRSMEQNNSSLATQTSSMQITMMQQQVAQKESENEGLRMENHELRRELDSLKNKPLLQQVEETRTLGRELGLFGKDEEGEFDWKKGLFETLKGAVNQAPEMMKSLSETRQANQAAVMQARQQAALAARRRQHQQLPAPTPAPGMAMTNQPASRARSTPADAGKGFQPTPAPGMQGSSPKPFWDGGPPDPFSGQDLPPAPEGPVSFQPRAEEEEGFTMAEPGAPKSIQSPETTVSDPTETETSAPVEDSSTPADEVQGKEAEEGDFEFTPEQLNEFALQLNGAIEGGVIDPATFADGFIEKVGPEATLALVGRITADTFIEAVSSSPEGAKLAMVTRRGQKYVRELWKQAREKSEAALSQA